MLSDADKANFLPPGYNQKNPNPQAVSMVDKLACDFIKTNKGILRGCVSFHLEYHDLCWCNVYSTAFGFCS
jgi:hypothetical protein